MIVNVHERHIPAPPERVGAMLETLGRPGDELWHTDVTAPMLLDRGLALGSRGGHGPIRYTVVEHVPGRLVRFQFDRGAALVGDHRLDVLDADGGCVLRHTLRGRTPWWAILLWPLVIRPLHNAAAEDILDHAERTLTGTAHRGQPTSGAMRAIGRRTSARRRVRTAPAVAGPLQRDGFDRIDAIDTWQTSILPADSRDPLDWACATLGRNAPVLGGLLKLRDALVRPLGLARTAADPPPTGFPLLSQSEDEVLLGLDDSHLSFLVGIRIVGDDVRVTTTVRIHNLLGRLYWAVVRWFHPFAVRSVLRQASYPVTGAGPEKDAG